VAEKDVSIHLNRYRLDASSELKSSGAFESVRVKASGVFYKHEELESNEVATTFLSRGAEARLDAKHAQGHFFGIGTEGVLGVQVQSSLLGVTGEEAFLPTHRKSSFALIAFEEAHLNGWTPSLGLRFDYSTVSTESSDRFGAGQSLGFFVPSASAGALIPLGDTYSLGLQTGLTLRAPNDQELFAQGAHRATGIYEVGNASLRPEIGRSLELSLRRKDSKTEGRLSVFIQDFTRYLALSPTGSFDLAESGLPIYEYQAFAAVMGGAELEYRYKFDEQFLGGFWDLGLTLDWVRGLNRDQRVNLPRMTPVRESFVLGYRSKRLSSEIEFQRSETQGCVAPGEYVTDAYSMVNLTAEYPMMTSWGSVALMGKVNNVFNVEARNHVSYVKDIAPLPGRNGVLSLQIRL
jgi:iron complex outermembrane receptor protein